MARINSIFFLMVLHLASINIQIGATQKIPLTSMKIIINRLIELSLALSVYNL